MNQLTIRASVLAMRRAGIVVSLLALSFTAYAQVERGTITGAVTDAKGSAIPDATVRVVEESTSQTVELHTDSAGEIRPATSRRAPIPFRSKSQASRATSIRASSFKSSRPRGSTLCSTWGRLLSQSR